MKKQKNFIQQNITYHIRQKQFISCLKKFLDERYSTVVETTYQPNLATDCLLIECIWYKYMLFVKIFGNRQLRKWRDINSAKI